MTPIEKDYFCCRVCLGCGMWTSQPWRWRKGCIYCRLHPKPLSTLSWTRKWEGEGGELLLPALSAGFEVAQSPRIYLGSHYPRGEAFGGERRASFNSSSLNPSALLRCFRAARGFPPESWFQFGFRSILILPPSTPLRFCTLVALKLFIHVPVHVLSAWSCISAPRPWLFAMPLSLRVPGRP